MRSGAGHGSVVSGLTWGDDPAVERGSGGRSASHVGVERDDVACGLCLHALSRCHLDDPGIDCSEQVDLAHENRRPFVARIDTFEFGAHAADFALQVQHRLSLEPRARASDPTIGPDLLQPFDPSVLRRHRYRNVLDTPPGQAKAIAFDRRLRMIVADDTIWSIRRDSSDPAAVVAAWRAPLTMHGGRSAMTTLPISSLSPRASQMRAWRPRTWS